VRTGLAYPCQVSQVTRPSRRSGSHGRSQAEAQLTRVSYAATRPGRTHMGHQARLPRAGVPSLGSAHPTVPGLPDEPDVPPRSRRAHGGHRCRHRRIRAPPPAPQFGPKQTRTPGRSTTASRIAANQHGFSEAIASAMEPGVIANLLREQPCAIFANGRVQRLSLRGTAGHLTRTRGTPQIVAVHIGQPSFASTRRIATAEP
jgi:hypothetical protein